jgi:hypothetical protein
MSPAGAALSARVGWSNYHPSPNIAMSRKPALAYAEALASEAADAVVSG